MVRLTLQSTSQITRSFRSKFILVWKYGIEYGRNFQYEWNREWKIFSMEWKIFSMEWKWNGRKLPVWNMEKSSSIPFHALLNDGAAAAVFPSPLLPTRKSK